MSSSPSPPSHSRCHPRRRPHLTVDVTPAIAAFEQSMSSPPSLPSNSRCRPHRRHLLAVDVVPPLSPSNSLYRPRRRRLLTVGVIAFAQPLPSTPSYSRCCPHVVQSSSSLPCTSMPFLSSSLLLNRQTPSCCCSLCPKSYPLACLPCAPATAVFSTAFHF